MCECVRARACVRTHAHLATVTCSPDDGHEGGAGQKTRHDVAVRIGGQDTHLSPNLRQILPTVLAARRRSAQWSSADPGGASDLLTTQVSKGGSIWCR